MQIYIDEPLDEALGREAARRGISKAAVVRGALSKEFDGVAHPESEDPWDALIGLLDSDPVDDIDAIIYEQRA